MNYLFKPASAGLSLIFLSALFMACNVDAAEWSVESDVNARFEYNDNIFVTTLDHESVTGLIVTPSIQMQSKEKNWETMLDARLRSNNYSDSTIDGNDIYFDFTGRYSTERNTYSLNAALDFDSNLNASSSAFALIPRRVEREDRRITPLFTRAISERLLFTGSYTYADVDFIDVGNLLFIPYKTDTASGSLVYNVSEKDQLNFVLQGIAYESKDNTFEYDLLITRLGMDHKLSESFSVNYLVGTSNRNSISRSTIVLDFLGRPIIIPQLVESSNRGLVYDAGFEQTWVASSLEGRVSRDNVTDSFGGLNEVDKVRLVFEQKLTQVWKYLVKARYEDIKSIDTANQVIDREIVFFEPIVSYSLDKDWRVMASYRYVRRKLESQTKDQAPDSNRIFIGMSYNFPSLSTF